MRPAGGNGHGVQRRPLLGPGPRSCRRPLAGGRDARFRPGFPFRQNGSEEKPAKGKRTGEPVFFVRALFWFSFFREKRAGDRWKMRPAGGHGHGVQRRPLPGPGPRSCRRPLAGGRDARFRLGFPFRQNGSEEKPAKGKRTGEPIFRQNGSGEKPAKGKRTGAPVFFVRALF